jgi:hypothetical protein
MNVMIAGINGEANKVMPETIHCSKCGKSIRVKNFGDMMVKLRRHYKEYHPILFKRSIKKGIETRKKSRK